MNSDNHKLGQENGQETTVYCGGPVDFDFLKSQTFADAGLESELLELFVAQSNRILSSLSTLGSDEQTEQAHLLKGSARAIGAVDIADLTARFEGADSQERMRLLPTLAAAIEQSSQAIDARLAELRRQMNPNAK